MSRPFGLVTDIDKNQIDPLPIYVPVKSIESGVIWC